MSALLSAGLMIAASGCSQPASSSGNIGDITFVDGDKIAVIEMKDFGTVKAKLFPDIAPVGVENFVRLAEQGYYNGLKIHRVVQDGVIQGGSLNGDGTGGIAAFTGEEVKENETAPSVFPVEISEKARNFYGALGYAADAYGQNATQFYIVDCKTPKDVTKTDAAKVQARADELAALAEAATWEAGSNTAKAVTYQQSYYSANASMLSKMDEAVAKKYAETGGMYEIDGAYTIFGQVYEGFDVIDAIAAVKVETNAQGERSMPVRDIIISSVTIETYKTSTAEADDGKKDSKSQPAEDSSKSEKSTAEAGTAQSTAEDISTVDTKETA